MDVCVEVLADDVWAAEDDKTGFLSVELDCYESVIFEKLPTSLHMVQISTKIAKYIINEDKWES